MGYSRDWPPRRSVLIFVNPGGTGMEEYDHLGLGQRRNEGIERTRRGNIEK
jgi:hypothetical protein